MTRSNRIVRAFRRALAAVVAANVSYTRAVHGNRALADGAARGTTRASR